MRQPPAPNGLDHFHSAKSRGAILVRSCSLFGDALVQASLDPAVPAFAFLPAAGVPAASVRVGVVVVERDDGCFRLDVESAGSLRTIEETTVCTRSR